MKFVRACWLGMVIAAVFTTAQTANTESKTAIKVDQAGYLPNAPKLAMVVAGTGSAQASQMFSIRRTNNDSVVFRGELTQRLQISAS